MMKINSNVLRKCSALKFPAKYFKNHVNTLSPLASVFNKPISIHAEGANNVGLFNVPELKTSSGFYHIKDDVLKKGDNLVQQAIKASPSTDVISIFDTLSDELCKVADLAEFIRLLHPNEDFARAAETASFGVGGFVEQLNTHYHLYCALKDSVLRNGQNMDAVTKIVADLFLFDFEQSGIHLDEKKRRLAVELHQAVLMVGAEFTKHTSGPRRYPLNLWPTDLQIPYAIDGDSIIVDSAYSESTNANMRENCYKAYMSSDKEQLRIFESLLLLRDQLASVLGFESFAHRTLRGTMASDPTTVSNFLINTLEMLEKPLAKELDVIKNYKKNFDSLHQTSVNSWDVKYYSSLISTQTSNLSSKQIREYFSLGACMEGLNLIFTSLFGVSLHVVEAAPGEVWAPDVQKVEVRHETEGVLGYIYCDFYQRPGKLPQDCHFTIRGGKELPDGSYQTPIVSLVCNFPSPGFDTPSLLSQNMVENLFHEMGHAMHSMLGRAKYQHVTGTRCPTDFAEVPSILMEYFAMDPRILPLYAKHYKTGQALPQEIIDGMITSKKQFAAIDLQVQTFYSIVDQVFHGKRDHGLSTTDMLEDLQKQYSPISHTPGTAWHLRFSHFHSYAAKYYAYVWSKAVASRIWYSCFQTDPLSRSTGERYRDTMLKHGGGQPPNDMVANMLGRAVNTNDLVNSLHEDLNK